MVGAEPWTPITASYALAVMRAFAIITVNIATCFLVRFFKNLSLERTRSLQCKNLHLKTSPYNFSTLYTVIGDTSLLISGPFNQVFPLHHFYISSHSVGKYCSECLHCCLQCLELFTPLGTLAERATVYILLMFFLYFFIYF